MKEILMLLVSAFAGALIFAFGYFAGYTRGSKNKSPFRFQKIADLYCLNCEIEMPVKEKNGLFYCSNCGLSHGKP